MLQAIAREIERYLGANDGAADSAEGVRGFWLSPALRAAPLEHVIAALDRLEKRGLIEKRHVGVGFVYAKRAPGTLH
ncbi:MAG: hypothetical protein ABI728_04250 [Betaproteobacteria bacterium]